MAYAALAELPPIYGLYTSFLAPIIYAVSGMCQLVRMCANNVLLSFNSTLCNTTYLEIFNVQNF